MAQSASIQTESDELKQSSPYTLTEIKPVGAEISGIDLATADLTDELIRRIKSDIHAHELLIFKHQAPDTKHIIAPMKRIEIAKKLGTIVSSHYDHPNAPHRDIFRVSNDAQFGCLKVGRTGWHIDGTFLQRPYRYSMMHIVAVPKRGFGQTAFISSQRAIGEVLNAEMDSENDSENLPYTYLPVLVTMYEQRMRPYLAEHGITEWRGFHQFTFGHSAKVGYGNDMEDVLSDDAYAHGHFNGVGAGNDFLDGKSQMGQDLSAVAVMNPYSAYGPATESTLAWMLSFEAIAVLAMLCFSVCLLVLCGLMIAAWFWRDDRGKVGAERKDNPV